MTLRTVLDGLVERFQEVEGLSHVLDYEPTAVQDAPMMYLSFVGATVVRSGHIDGMRYRILARVCIRWQDNEMADREVATFVDSVKTALYEDRTLGSRLTSGLAELDEIVGDWDRVGGAVYRVVDFYVEVLEK